MKWGEGLPRKKFLRKNSVETLATQAIQEIFSESFLRCKGVFGNKVMLASNSEKSSDFKVARYSFSGSIPSKFEHKLRRHKQSFRKIATTVVLDEDGNLL